MKQGLLYFFCLQVALLPTEFAQAGSWNYTSASNTQQLDANGNLVVTATTSNGTAVQAQTPTVIANSAAPAATSQPMNPMVMPLAAAGLTGLMAWMSNKSPSKSASTPKAASIPSTDFSPSPTNSPGALSSSRSPNSQSSNISSDSGRAPSSSISKNDYGPYTPYNANSGKDCPIPTPAKDDLMKKIAASGAAGVGRLREGPVCYRSVKKIIADALGKNLNCVRGVLKGGSAKNAMQDLVAAGFENNKDACFTQGVIRVYNGAKSGAGRGSAGDTHGHIEVIGADNMYHSFYSSAKPIDVTFGNQRRPLIGCFVPNYKKIYESGPIAKCGGAASRGSSYKPKSPFDALQNK